MAGWQPDKGRRLITTRAAQAALFLGRSTRVADAGPARPAGAWRDTALGHNAPAGRSRGPDRAISTMRSTFSVLMSRAALAACCLAAGSAAAQSGAVYRCPGKTGGADEFTNMLSAEEARARGCRTIDGAPITIVQGGRPRAASSANGGASANGSAPRASEAKVDPAAQRQRDSDARRILEAELRREEERLAQLRRDYNNGEPERRGDERNYQKYLDRTAELKAAITRSESDVAAIKRELAKIAP